MSLQLTQEQRQLRESLRRMLEATYGFEVRRSAGASTLGWSRTAWKNLCEMGVLALKIPEEYDGLEGTAFDIAVVMIELGRVLALEPYFTSAVLSATALNQFSRDEHAATLLPKIASGEQVIAWAHDEKRARHRYNWVETQAERRKDQWVLTGVKQNVLQAGVSDGYLVSARIDNSLDGYGKTALFLVDPNEIGVSLRQYRLVDDTVAGELKLDKVLATPLGSPFDETSQLAALMAVRAMGIVALCAEALGVMECAFELTCEYARTRKQFGRALGENQAYRHQLAEMAVAIESCRSAVSIASRAVDSSNDQEDRFSDLLRAKMLTGYLGRTVCHQAIQLHGGIGITEEYKVGHCLRKLFVIDQLFGDADSSAEMLAERLFVGERRWEEKTIACI